LDNKIDCAVAAIADGKTFAGAIESAFQQSVTDSKGSLAGGKAVLKGVGGDEEMRSYGWLIEEMRFYEGLILMFYGWLILRFHSRLIY
jgi:hypothetical protein